MAQRDKSAISVASSATLSSFAPPSAPSGERWGAAIGNLGELGSNVESLQKLLARKAVFVDDDVFSKASLAADQARSIKLDMRTPDAHMKISFGIPASAGFGVGHRWDPMDCDEEAAPRARPALRMDCDFSCLANHDEDAFFCHSRASVVGVADGVGGCRGDGVDAAEFSHELMSNASDEVAASSPGTRGIYPYTVLERAYQKTVASVRTRAASTALILSLAGNALRWAYVGDSAFAVFRGGKLLLRSAPQQHYFNCPYQLSAVGGSRVSDAAAGEFPVKEGDVLVAGTDGLFDNVFDSALEEMVRKGTELRFTPGQMAEAMAEFANDMAGSSRESPFSAASREQLGTNYTGGKMDDITVIVAFIVS